MNTIVQEKVEQAVGVVSALGVDAWLTFVRETTETGDPVLPIILGQPVTWQSAPSTVPIALKMRSRAEDGPASRASRMRATRSR